MTPIDGPVEDADRRSRRLRQRNWAVAAALVLLVVVFYVITLHKGVPLITNRPL